MKANVSVDFFASKDLYTEKGASGKKTAQNVSRESKTDIKNPENTKVLLKKCKLTPEEAVSQGVNTEMKDTEAENNGVENTEIQNTNLKYPDDPRERLEEEFRKLL